MSLTVLTTKEVASKLGLSIRRTQELINGRDMTRVEIKRNGSYTLGVPANDVTRYQKLRSTPKTR